MGNTNVILEVNGKQKSFPFNHANLILKMPHNGGWKLPTETDYIYTTKHGLKRKRNKGDNKEAEKLD